MFKRLFNKVEKITKKEKTYRVRVAWINDVPWYMNLTKKDIIKYENNADVLDVLILG